MNLIIEVIDGVAYVVEEAKTYRETCKKCTFVKCDCWCEKKYIMPVYYRRLTQTEREELQKAIGRGIE